MESDSTLCTATRMKILGTPSTSLAYFQRSSSGIGFQSSTMAEVEQAASLLGGKDSRIGKLPVLLKIPPLIPSET